MTVDPSKKGFAMKTALERIFRQEGHNDKWTTSFELETWTWRCSICKQSFASHKKLKAHKKSEHAY